MEEFILKLTKLGLRVTFIDSEYHILEIQVYIPTHNYTLSKRFDRSLFDNLADNIKEMVYQDMYNSVVTRIKKPAPEGSLLDIDIKLIYNPE